MVPGLVRIDGRQQQVPDDVQRGAAVEAEQAELAEAARSYTPALSVIERYLRLICAWPEGRGPVARVLGEHVLPYTFLMTAIPPLAYFALGEHGSDVELIGFMADALGSTLCLFKMKTLQRHSAKIISVREMLKGFEQLELPVAAEARKLNERCERRSGGLAHRFVRVYSILSVTTVISMALAVVRNEPWMSVKTPSFIMQSTPAYLGAVLITTVEMYVFPVAIGSFDSLLSTLCLHMACKCDVLVLMLQRAVSEVAPASESEEQEAGGGGGEDSARRLRLCVVYHQRIMRMHREAESIVTTVALCQMLYTIVGLGTPLFRMLDKTQAVALQDVIFSLTYVSWTFCQFFTFCFFGDILAASSGRVAAAGYASFQPTLTVRDTKLDSSQYLLLQRAQRPLLISAGRISNLTLRLFQDIMSRSYSLYSTVLRMR